MKKLEVVRLVELLLAHQQRLQACTELYRPKLDLLTGHIFSLIQATETKIASELLLALGVEKSTLSRTLAALEQSGYLYAEVDKKDGRRQLLSLTAHGVQIFQDTNALLTKAFLDCVAPLSPTQLKQLETSYRTLANAFACPPALVIKELHPALRELRRLSRPFGILSGHFAATNLSATEFHALRVISKSKSNICAKEIASILLLSRASISRAVTRLDKLNLVEFEENESDGRSSLIRITSTGKRLLASALEDAANLLATTLEPFGIEFVSRLCSLLECYTSVSAPLPLEMKEFRPEYVKTAADRHEAYIFFLEELIRQGRQKEISENIFSDRGRLACVRRNGTLVGVCDFMRRKNQWKIEKAVFSRPYTGSPAETMLIEACYRVVDPAANSRRE